ncbi:hypothetical protein G6O67_003490 [Ophiocordyceps sinensis]|uniref:Cell wall galactomannoprotein n=2 Tax=Ophiocordyceps sinensis TaxID=72228 RepID=A0A8H4PWG5_9HYPO|nr:cell wall protein [Ophiocordyceps sinensis CO18]KAF4511718.1 hypothetical protein G6O67_003490 [Ophiocordyceps sinensis]
MKFSAPLALACLATGAYAGPAVIQRNADTIAAVLAQVESAIGSLTTTVEKFSGDVSSVVSKAEVLVATIDSGATAVQGSSSINLQEALQLLPAVDRLRDSGSALSKELVARRAVVQATGQCDQTRTQIDHIFESSSRLIAVFVSKVPVAAQEIANKKASQVTQVLKQAKDDFAQGKC